MDLPKNCRRIGNKVVCKVEKGKIEKMSKIAEAGSGSVNIEIPTSKKASSMKVC